MPDLEQLLKLPPNEVIHAAKQIRGFIYILGAAYNTGDNSQTYFDRVYDERAEKLNLLQNQTFQSFPANIADIWLDVVTCGLCAFMPHIAIKIKEEEAYKRRLKEAHRYGFTIYNPAPPEGVLRIMTWLEPFGELT